ncbi:hypothetical protein [Methylobacterium aerolatum]|uniref:Uncharacterized protein n=1 Tax=Methylobacterium aerolatum TaxID=418708 RepID=A0ABU0HZ84_9HYPH|nr:hypothetical protein [Methylobacterium aerolatum]MDQ0447118.1 hypothetical protein [Methylobacterium aerolatum]GJD37099.1 hypothetical protein FMGBMHLM_4025 [Methylobacterium aerolatum]
MLVRLLLAATVACAGLALQPDAASAQSPAQSFVYQQKRFRNACRPPLKFAAGACVRRCPAGYRDDGGYCRLTSQRMR